MKFGDNKPNTASFIAEKIEQENIIKPPSINHLTGLGFPEGTPVIIHLSDDKLSIEAEWEEKVDTPGVMVPKIEKHTSTKEINISDIQGIDITDESGRSLGKTALLGAIGLVTLGPLGLIGGALLGGRKRWKSFLIFQVKPENKPPYSIVFGGRSQKEIRSYYDHLIEMINAE